MNTDLDVRPDVTTSDGDEDDHEHAICCCSPNVALCGVKVAGETCTVDWCEHESCPRCDQLIEAEAICILCGFGYYGPCACGTCPS